MPTPAGIETQWSTRGFHHHAPRMRQTRRRPDHVLRLCLQRMVHVKQGTKHNPLTPSPRPLFIEQRPRTKQKRRSATLSLYHLREGRWSHPPPKARYRYSRNISYEWNEMWPRPSSHIWREKKDCLAHPEPRAPQEPALPYVTPDRRPIKTLPLRHIRR